MTKNRSDRKSITPSMQKMIDALIEHGPMSYKEISKASCVRESTVWDYMSILVKLEKVHVYGIRPTSVKETNFSKIYKAGISPVGYVPIRLAPVVEHQVTVKNNRIVRDFMLDALMGIRA